jgi:TP901 family phage tail tape measure protein
MSSFGADMSKYVTLPLVAVGAGLSKLGATFDDAFDAIRINSGATGDALEALQDDFKEVAKRVPSDFEQISTSIADYNTRLGITGEILQDLSVQTLNLARITGGNLGKIIEETSQTFQAFNIPVKEYGESLDYIFKVSQSTGIAIERLEANLVKFAPALKQMGFEFKESAALMGYFDKAGVDVEQAMMGLNKALVTMSKAGVKDASEALQMLFDDIQNAPTAMAGAELAIETFGAKAGPALASAIMEGKLGFADLMAELEASEETIESATEATDSWAESLAKLKNRVAMAIEPIASTMFDTLSELVETIADSVTPAIEKMGEAFEGMPKSVQVTILAIMGLLAVTGPLIKGIGAIVMAAPGLSAAFSAMGPIITGITGAFSTLAGVVMPLLGAAAAALGVSIGPLLLALAAIVAVVILVIKNFDEAKQMARDFGEFVGGMLTKLWEGIKKGAAKLAEWITDWWDEIKETWLERFEKVLEFFSNFKEKVFEIFSSLGETLKSIAEFVFKAIFGHFERTAKLLVGGTIYLVSLMVEKWMAFKEGIIDVWESIVAAIFAFVNNIIDLVNIVISALNTIQVEIPDWVPEFGGQKFGIDIAPLEHLDREKQLLTGEQVREEEKKIEVSGRSFNSS